MEKPTTRSPTRWRLPEAPAGAVRLPASLRWPARCRSGPDGVGRGDGEGVAVTVGQAGDGDRARMPVPVWPPFALLVVSVAVTV